MRDKPLNLEVDLYQNVMDYVDQGGILPILQEEKTGSIFGLKYGNLTKGSNWAVGLYYAIIEKYSAVDYLADNHWARWDYSEYSSKASRLTNMKGFEFTASYAFDEHILIKLRAFFVEQIINERIAKETGNRIRMELIAKF